VFLGGEGMIAVTLHNVMSEIGPLLDLAEVVEFAECGPWTLAFEDGLVLEVELDDANHRVVLSMEIGDLPPDRASALSATLLQYNLLWRETGGVRFALAGDSVAQLLDLAVDRADLPTLAVVAKSLHANALRWQTLLSASAPPASVQPALPPGGAIRV
jgi:hypothetical protein